MATDSISETTTRQGGSLDAPLADVRARLVTELRSAWVRPVAAPDRFAVAEDRIEKLAKQTLDTMLVRTFRVTPLPPPDEYNQLLTRVCYWVRRGEPIHLMLGYAPMKNPRTVGHTHADWAEFFALAHLAAWHNKVCTVYPPGLRIKIVFDDSTIRMANRYDKRPMDDYIGSIRELIRVMGFQSFIVGTMRQSSFAWLFHFGLYQLARLRLLYWERDPANAGALARMLEFARRNVVAPSGLTGEESERYYRAAAHRYRVYWEALQLSGLSRMGHKIVAMYLDGHQHHLRQPSALHLTSVGKGQVTQPWQGEGALRDNGHGRLIPTVLTSKRREQLVMQTIDIPGVFPLAGFESIVLCRDSLPADHYSAAS